MKVKRIRHTKKSRKIYVNHSSRNEKAMQAPSSPVRDATTTLDTSLAMQGNLTYSIDDIMKHIGEFGLYQKLLITTFFFSCLPASYQILMFYFSTITPSWVCITNSTICTINGTLSPDDSRRCSMSRDEWKYTESKSYSFITDFELDCSDEWLVHLASSMIFFG